MTKNRYKKSNSKFTKPNKKGRCHEKERFVKLPYPLIESEAWRCLRHNSIKVFIELHRRYNGFNNGRIFLSYKEAKKYLDISPNTMCRALIQLQKHGFIRLKCQGGLNGRKASEWALTHLPSGNYPATNEWKNWGKRKTPSAPLLDPTDYPVEMLSAAD